MRRIGDGNLLLALAGLKHYGTVCEDRKADAVTHLAVARSQNTGNGILGILQKMKGSCVSGCRFSFLRVLHYERKTFEKA